MSKKKNDIPKKKINNSKSRITLPITYPDKRYKKTDVAKPSELNVEHAKEWVDFNEL